MNQKFQKTAKLLQFAIPALAIMGQAAFAQATTPKGEISKPAQEQPKTEPAKPVAPVPAPEKKDAPKTDPSLTNDQDMLPNGHLSHRVATPKQEKLTILGRIQMRAMSGQQDTVYSNPGTDYGLVDFNFRRLRLGALYQGDHHWGVLINLRLENALNKTSVNQSTCTVTSTPSTCTTAVSLNDNRGIIHEANLWYNFDFMRTSVIFGMINVPFSREFLASSANLLNIERALGTNPQNQFDNGLMVRLNPLKVVDKKLDRYLTVWGMVGTGHGGGGDFGFGRRYDSTNVPASNGTVPAGTSSTYTPTAPMFYGRIQYNALGGISRGSREIGWQDGEEIFQNDLKLSFGAAIMGTKEMKITNPMPVEYTARLNNNVGSIPLSMATGSAGNGTGSCQVSGGVAQNCNLIAHTYDVVATWKGMYFSAAFFYYGGAAGQNITSYNAMIGYNLPLGISTYVMPVIRYDYMQGNFNNSGTYGTSSAFHTNTSGLASDPANQMTVWWVGVNLLADKHLFKLQLFYQINQNSWKGYDNSGSSLGGYAQNMVIFQAQGTFWTGADIANKPTHADL